MANILYIGFGELLKSSETNLTSNSTFDFIEIQQLSLNVNQKELQDADVFLIGPYTLDPVRQVQRASQQNPQVSIVVLIFQEQFHKVKQGIQFSFNIGKNVVYIPYQADKDITAVLNTAVSRTAQRTSFSRIREKQIYPLAETRPLTFQNMGVFLQNAPIGAIVFDIEKTVISANLKAKNMFSTQFNRLGKVTFNDLFADQVSFEKIPSASGINNNISLHDIIKVNDHFLEINISQMVLERNTPHYLLLLNDVTEKINSENLLKRKVEELEFLNQELDEFVNVVSHDFKTPLTAISLLAEMAFKEKCPEKQLDFIFKIKQSSGKLKDLLKGLTTLVDTKKERSDKVELVNLDDRMEGVFSEYKEMLEEIDGVIEADFSQAPTIAYFTAHIDSFLSNLLTNSIKYRQFDKPLLIEIKSRREKEFTVISVRDNGIGIDLAKNMNKLFKPFKRLTDQSTGSGLGLSLIKRMIEKDQGYLEVFSTPGNGTEFKAYLKDQG